MTDEVKRKPGRPMKIAPWFTRVAKRMRDGTTLRNALMWERIQLDPSEIRKLYKNVELRRLYQIERQLYMLSDYGKRPLTDEEKFRKTIERSLR